MERVVSRKLARDINCTEILPANQGGAAAFTLIMMCTKAYGRKNKRCLWQSISRMHATVQFKLLMENIMSGES